MNFLLGFVNSREWFLQYDLSEVLIFPLGPPCLPLLRFPYSPAPPASGSTFFLSFLWPLGGHNFPHFADEKNQRLRRIW